MNNVSKEQLQQEEHYYDSGKNRKPDIVNGGEAILNFLKNIRPGSDLAGALAPTFALKPASFLEWMGDLIQPKSYMMKLHTLKSAEKRMLIIAKYALEACCTMPQEGVQEVKGYNPILGEAFNASWKHKNSTSEYFAEQVSHHPPISAGIIRNKTVGFQIEVVFQPKVKLTTSLRGPYVQSHIEGAVYFHLHPHNEVYTIHFPHFVCKNLLFGGSYCELSETLKVECTNGYSFDMTYKSKGKCHGQIALNKQKVYKLEGTVNDRIVLTNLSNNQASVLVSHASITFEPKEVKPVVEQESHESRRVWHLVTKAIHDKNLSEATKQKSVIEEEQRQFAKQRKDSGQSWKSQRFVEVVGQNGKPIMLGKSTPHYRSVDFDKFEFEKKGE